MMKRLFWLLFLASCMVGCSDYQTQEELDNTTQETPNSGDSTDTSKDEQEQHTGTNKQDQQHEQQEHKGCGSCQPDEQCVENECIPKCVDSTYCDGDCLDLKKLHLSDCGSCAPDWCDINNNLKDGCETRFKGNDPNNCGSCGNQCTSGVCQNGVCLDSDARRMMVLIDDLKVRTGPGASNTSIGSVNKYDYIMVTDEQDGWFRHEFEGQEGWSSGGYLLDVCDDCEGRKAIDYAEQFLYDSSTKLCTYDHLTYTPILENFTDLSTYGATYDYGYDCNCANFVTACLKSVGLISANIINVKGVKSHCLNGTDGWHQVEFKDAKAGDIWINPSEGHSELVVGYKDGKVYLIGSNNFRDTDGVNNCQQTVSGAKGSDYQRVSYDSATESGTGMICTH